MAAMLLSVLRVAGHDLDVDAFLAAHPGLEPDAVWRKGEVHRVVRSRGPHADSGVNVILVAEEATWPTLVNATFAELERLRPVLADLRALGASAEVDFGVEVASDEFVRSLRLQEDELRRAADLGVRLCVSVYPAERQVVKVGLVAT